MRRRKKLLPKPTPAIYKSLTEVETSSESIDVGSLIPADRSRIAQANMGGFDGLPPPVRTRVREIDSQFTLDIRDRQGTTIKGVTLVRACVILLDSGASVEQIVKMIDGVEAALIKRTQGVS